jgi:hypothetical protein
MEGIKKLCSDFGIQELAAKLILYTVTVSGKKKLVTTQAQGWEEIEK